MNVSTKPSSISRLTANIGVEVGGVDLGNGVTSDVLDLLRAAVAEHHVIVFRDQFLTADEHAAVARAFGPIQPSPVQLATGTADASGSVSTIEDTAARPPAGFPWHSDLSWLREPPALGFLSAVLDPVFRRRHHLGVEQRHFRRPPPTDPGAVRAVHGAAHPRSLTARVGRAPPRHRGRRPPPPRAARRRAPARATASTDRTPAPVPVTAVRHATSSDPPAPTAPCSPTCTPCSTTPASSCDGRGARVTSSSGTNRAPVTVPSPTTTRNDGSCAAAPPPRRDDPRPRCRLRHATDARIVDLDDATPARRERRRWVSTAYSESADR